MVSLQSRQRVMGGKTIRLFRGWWVERQRVMGGETEGDGWRENHRVMAIETEGDRWRDRVMGGETEGDRWIDRQHSPETILHPLKQVLTGLQCHWMLTE